MRDGLFGERHAGFVRVALPVPIDSLFDYSVPENQLPLARVGARAQVPFSGRSLTGVIVEVVDDPHPGKLASIERVVDPEPVLSPLLLDVLREEAAATLCPFGIALQAALPAGSAPTVVEHWSITARGSSALRSGAVRGDVRKLLLDLERATAPANRLAKLGISREQLRELAQDGLVARESRTGAPRVAVSRERWAEIPESVDVEAACSGVLARAPKQAQLLRRLAASGPQPSNALSAPEALRALAARGLVEFSQREKPRDVLGPLLEADKEVVLTPEQAQVLEPICGAVEAGRFEQFLLHGVTGSGKTEVYLRAVASALATGRTALVLVPEITLTHQIVARLRARFGDELAVLHSGLRPSERLEQWERLRRGHTPIAVGARSALFAPLDKLGLIVIDEEHDNAYKNDEGFRYHARSLAARRARAAGCPVILGSATPALETRYAAETGEVVRLVLPRRIGGRPLPAVELVDLTVERRKVQRGRKMVLTAPLRQGLRDLLDDGGQAILFLNRRGFSTQILCFDCGHAERCKHCDVALVYHASEERMRCHYCDASAVPPEACSGCGAPDTALMGIGTERLEEEVRTLFPAARIGRLDRDSARRRGYTESLLNALRQGELDILIGTQMVAKGHDFPGVRLVGVVAADIGLHLPDFRAAERTFQLLTQVAGRAGRDIAPGRVVIQTFVPDHYALRPVRTHDYERFYRDEIAQRRALGYPPFGHLAQVMVSSEDEESARANAQVLADRARDTAPHAGVEVLGPAPAALARLRNRYRYQVLVKAAERESMMAAARRVSDALASLPKEIHANVDVQPTSML